MKHKNKQGYITLMSVLVVSTVSIAIVISVILLGIGSSRNAFSYQQSYQAKGLADACAEEGLEAIRELTSFTGATTLTTSDGTCTYTVTAQAGENRTIDATSTVDFAVRKTKVVVSTINPTIIISSWAEVQ